MTRIRSTTVTAVIVAFVTAGVTSLVADTQTDGSAALLAGAWHLNDELSPDASLQPPATPDGTGGTAGGRRGGGGFGRPGRGGGFGGGRFGGGGFGPPGGGPEGGGRSSIAEGAEERNRMRELAREMRRAPKRIALVVTDKQLNTTADDGTVLTLPLNNKKTKVSLGGEMIEARAKWDGASIVTEWAAGDLKLTRTYRGSPDGKVLTVVVGPQGGDKDDGRGRPPVPSMTLVYDRD